MTHPPSITIADESAIAVRPSIDGRASHLIRIDELDLVIGGSDIAAIGAADRLIAALNEIRAAALFRLAADEATVILFERVGLDDGYGAGGAVEAARG